jgi:hypothetical protein
MNKKLLLLIAILGIMFLLSSCGQQMAPAPTPTPTPQPATLTVYSQCWDCWGYVIINGASTGKWIDQNGAVTVTGLTPGSICNVQIADNWGFWSHTESTVLQPGNNIVVFDRFF